MVLFVLSGLFALVVGLLMFTGSSVLLSLPGMPGIAAGGAPSPDGVDPETAGRIAAGIFKVFGLVGLVFAGLHFLVAWGIYNLQNWARIVAIILAVISLLSIPIGTLFGLIILYFLVLDRNTVAAFASGGAP
jgi:hypothetical protein